MLRRSMIRNLALLAVVGLGFSASSAQAGFSGSFSISGFGTTYTPGTTLAGATSFSFTQSVVTASADGFAGIPVSPIAPTLFGPATFTTTGSPVFSISNATYGTFTETSFSDAGVGIVNGTVISRTFLLQGTYVGGAVGTTAIPASITLVFTQNIGATTVGSSGDLVIPPLNPVPEPASVAMLGLGLVAVGGYGLRRRMAK